MRKHRRRMTAAVAAALIAAAGSPAAALAVPDAAKYTRATTGQTPSEFAQPVTSAPVGDTKFDVAQPETSAPVGDTKSDAPGASRAPKHTPLTTVQVVRPERTIVRDADPALPIVLAGLALLIAVGAGGTALVRVRSLRLG
jgi:hypothetical protein